jgi:tetratricopeptide (TPR) repeat protein
MASYMMDQLDAARTAFKRAVSSPIDSSGKQEASKWLAYLEDDSASEKQLSASELEALVERRPNDPIARLRLAERYEKQGAIENAVAQYETALDTNPNLVNAKLKLAQLYAGPLHDFRKALELAKAARELAAGDPQVDGILGSIAYKAGNFIWAYSLLQQAARRVPNDLVIVHDLAWSAYSLGKVREASEIMSRVVQASPSSGLAEDGKSFLKTAGLHPEDLVAAEPEINALLAKDHDYVPALFAKATLEMRRGKSKEAIQTYNKVLQRFPDFAPAQKQLAALYLEDPARIADAYDLALKARNTLSDDEDLAQILGEISYKRKDFATAIQWFRESARKKPLTGRDLYYIGMSQLRTDQRAESRKTLEKALSAGLQEPMLQETKALLADPQIQ